MVRQPHEAVDPAAFVALCIFNSKEAFMGEGHLGASAFRLEGNGYQREVRPSATTGPGEGQARGMVDLLIDTVMVELLSIGRPVQHLPLAANAWIDLAGQADQPFSPQPVAKIARQESVEQPLRRSVEAAGEGEANGRFDDGCVHGVSPLT